MESSIRLALLYLGKRLLSKSLKYIDVPLMTNHECVSNTGWKPQQITLNMICAGDLAKQGDDSCEGDSGGPLVTMGRDDTAIVYGVVSFGHIEGCGHSDFPGIYTRVTVFLDWIRSKMIQNVKG